MEFCPSAVILTTPNTAVGTRPIAHHAFGAVDAQPLKGNRIGVGSFRCSGPETRLRIIASIIQRTGRRAVVERFAVDDVFSANQTVDAIRRLGASSTEDVTAPLIGIAHGSRLSPSEFTFPVSRAENYHPAKARRAPKRIASLACP